ncbi:S1C family serine protease [Sessilibacter corallicola]|uniref:S1C family serine protease n=1 Tax=Sessilibacter corallicola TaxID=2904075 RepID=UPI001E5EA02D|nr:trypsin-like peptidase domain-containing protein [Sessilibacter corallicola]MCE2027059.1 trypsin-like peptidase domain-containing protein [Sessilibacter corallicola]
MSHGFNYSRSKFAGVTDKLLFILLFAVSSLTHALTEDEKNNIQVFKESSQSVVFVTNNTLVRDPYSFNVSKRPQGTGTGFVWDKQGHIVTNFHVIDGAREITITLSDQSSWNAAVVGLAPEKDIAVLKIEAPSKLLKPLPIGDSEALQVGRKVLAIGNPFGLDTTLTVGVVSALGREIQAPNQRTIQNVIQTDAAINPGNSGGPLLNSDGELIGVNAAIYSPNGASIGIGFAIPVNSVKKIVPELIQYGHLVRPVIGVELAPISWARNNNLPGVPVLRVTRNGPADRAGMEGITRNRWGATILGDVIAKIDNKSVNSIDELLGVLESYKPGDRVAITIIRQNREKTLRLTLAAPN